MHAILNKNYFKEDYVEQIESLIEEVNLKEVEKKLRDDLGKVGKILLEKVKNKDYLGAIRLKRKLLFKLFSRKYIFSEKDIFLF